MSRPEALFEIRLKNFSSVQHQKAIISELETESLEPGSLAILAVHAHEGRLSINESDAGIGYSLLFKALLQHTQNRVIVVIAHDDEAQYNKNGPQISAWIIYKLAHQFTPEELKGETGCLILSWNDCPMEIHLKAFLKFCELRGANLPMKYWKNLVDEKDRNCWPFSGKVVRVQESQQVDDRKTRWKRPSIFAPTTWFPKSERTMATTDALVNSFTVN